MNGQVNKFLQGAIEWGRTVFMLSATYAAVVLIYRAGEIRLFDDKMVCKTVYTTLPSVAEPARVVPYGGTR